MLAATTKGIIAYEVFEGTVAHEHVINFLNMLEKKIGMSHLLC
jgi:hypothetical protein